MKILRQKAEESRDALRKQAAYLILPIAPTMEEAADVIDELLRVLDENRNRN